MLLARALLVTFTLGLLAAPLPAQAQPASKIPRIGYLSIGSSTPVPPARKAFLKGLREHGWVEGKNIAIDWRLSDEVERLPDLAAELVRLKVDVIVAPVNLAVVAAQKATKTIPIVMVLVSDPIGLGLVANLARPGGNITGLTSQALELTGKRLQLLKEAVPNVSRFAVLLDPTFPGIQVSVRETEVAARALGMQLQLLEARSPSELDGAFAALTREGAGAVFFLGSPILFAHRARIAELAVKSRLPMMCSFREYVEAGCLMSYYTSVNDLFRRAATFVDKILKGAKPADLPVEQPMRFELVVNLKTAKALGLTIPPSVLFRADKVIR